MDNYTKVYGEDDPSFTSTIEYLQGSGPLGTVTYSREEGEEIGTYKINASVKSLNPNYAYTVETGILTIVASQEEVLSQYSVSNMESFGKVYNGKPLNIETSLSDYPYEYAEYYIQFTIKPGFINNMVADRIKVQIEGTPEINSFDSYNIDSEDFSLILFRIRIYRNYFWSHNGEYIEYPNTKFNFFFEDNPTNKFSYTDTIYDYCHPATVTINSAEYNILKVYPTGNASNTLYVYFTTNILSYISSKIHSLAYDDIVKIRNINNLITDITINYLSLHDSTNAPGEEQELDITIDYNIIDGHLGENIELEFDIYVEELDKRFTIDPKEDLILSY